jgi:hypothetical protein
VQAAMGGRSAIFHGGGGLLSLGMVSFGDATIPSREAIASMLSTFAALPGWSSLGVNSTPRARAPFPMGSYATNSRFRPGFSATGRDMLPPADAVIE